MSGIPQPIRFYCLILFLSIEFSLKLMVLTIYRSFSSRALVPSSLSMSCLTKYCSLWQLGMSLGSTCCPGMSLGKSYYGELLSPFSKFLKTWVILMSDISDICLRISISLYASESSLDSLL